MDYLDFRVHILKIFTNDLINAQGYNVMDYYKNREIKILIKLADVTLLF